MASFYEQLQRVWHAYENEHGYLPATAREACMWGVSRGMIAAPEYDPYDRLAEDMSRALRGEYATDRMGRRYRKNHAVRVTKGGVQYTMWAILGHSAREHMHKAFIQRREQIVGDCFHRPMWTSTTTCTKIGNRSRFLWIFATTWKSENSGTAKTPLSVSFSSEPERRALRSLIAFLA